MDAFWAAPPVARTLAAWLFIQSAAVHSHLLGGYRIVFYPPFLWKFPPELWRLVTPFFLSGGGLGILFDTFFLWQYGSELETGSASFTEPGSFLVFIVFVGLVILILGGFILGGLIFTHSLILALVWKYARDNRGKKVHFYVVTIDVKYLPFAILLLTFVTEGPGGLKTDLCGIFAAHLYEFLTRYWPEFGGGRSLISTPAFVVRWFSGPDARVQRRSHGTAIRPPSGVPPSQSSSVLPPSWRSRGSGHRLGGD